MHDSPSIILVRSGTYHKHLSSVKEWYSSQYDNWHTVDAQRNKWHVWNECNNAALHSAVQIQQYLIRTTEGNLKLVHNIYRSSVRNNVQQLAVFETFHLFVQTKLHLTGQIV